MSGLALAAGLAIFGMPPVDLHSPLHDAGVMDPFCGMTRGVAATMRADLSLAWWFNPASPLVVLGGVALVSRWLLGRLTGLWVNARLRWTPTALAIAVLMTSALEINQQLHVNRLR